MPSQGRSLAIDLKQLSTEETAQLATLLYPVHQQIFHGTDQATFRRQVLESNATTSRLSLRLNHLGQPVGYAAIHFFPLDHGARRACVVRGHAGLLREHRRGNRLAPFFLRQLLRYRLRHPWRLMYFFATLIHPSSYLLCDQYARRLWPRPTQALSPAEQQFLHGCLTHFGYPADNPAQPQVVSVGWQTRDHDQDQRDWSRNPRPAVQFFLAHNPDYRRGMGLVTLAPVSIRNLAVALKRMLVMRWQRRRRDSTRHKGQETICTAPR